MSQRRPTAPTADATRTDAAEVHRDLIRILRALRTKAGHEQLSSGQLSALWTIAAHAPIRATELAEYEGVAAPTMSRLVASLERDGMVVRTADPHDGRASLLSPSTAGTEYLRGTTSRKSELVERALDQFGSGDRVAIRRCMHLLADTMCGLTAPSNDTADEMATTAKGA